MNDRLRVLMDECLENNDFEGVMRTLRKGFQVPHDENVERWYDPTPWDYTIAYIVFYFAVAIGELSLAELKDLAAELCQYVDVWQDVGAHGNGELLSSYGRFPLSHCLQPGADERVMAVLRGMESAGVSIKYPHYNFLRWLVACPTVKVEDVQFLLDAGYSLEEMSVGKFDTRRVTALQELQEREDGGKHILWGLGYPVSVKVQGQVWSIRKQKSGLTNQETT